MFSERPTKDRRYVITPVLPYQDDRTGVTVTIVRANSKIIEFVDGDGVIHRREYYIWPVRDIE